MINVWEMSGDTFEERFSKALRIARGASVRTKGTGQIRLVHRRDRVINVNQTIYDASPYNKGNDDHLCKNVEIYPNGAILNWNGRPGGTMFHLLSPLGLVIHNGLTITGNCLGIHFDRASLHGYNRNGGFRNEFHGLHFIEVSQPILFGNKRGADHRMNRFVQTVVSNCRYGVEVKGANISGLVFDGLNVTNHSTYAVKSSASGGSPDFVVRSLVAHSHEKNSRAIECDGGAISIDRGRIEGSQLVLLSKGSDAARFPTTLSDVIVSENVGDAVLQGQGGPRIETDRCNFVVNRS